MKPKRTRHPGIERIGEKHYRVRVVVRSPRTGKRKEMDRKVIGSIAKAVAEKVRFRNELLAEEDPKTRMTLTAFARSWLDAKGPLKPSTLDKYVNDLEAHILPKLGDIFVDQLRPSDIHQFVARDKGSGWSKRNRIALLRQLAQDAIADGLTDINFTARVKLPEVHTYTEEDPNSLTAEELGKLLAEVEDSEPRWYPVILLQATTGLRWCEASALRWPDIDHAAGAIRVRRINWRGELLDKAKTRSSRRAVPLLEDVWEALQLHRHRLLKKQHPGLKAGWVFSSRTGELYRSWPLVKVLARACKAAKVAHVTDHGLRRTANNLIRQEAGSVVAQAILGHATEAMHEHYSTVRSDEKRAAAAQVYRLVRASGKSGDPSGDPVTASKEAKTKTEE